MSADVNCFSDKSEISVIYLRFLSLFMDVPYVVLKSTKYEITNSIEQMN